MPGLNLLAAGAASKTLSSLPDLASSPEKLNGPIDCLPKELLLHIFQYLSFRELFGTCRQVCWHWNAIAGEAAMHQSYDKKLLAKIDNLEDFFYQSASLVKRKIPDAIKGCPIRSVVFAEKNGKAIPKEVFAMHVADNPCLLNLTLHGCRESKLLSKFDGSIFKQMKNDLLILHIEGTSSKHARSFQLAELITKCKNLRSVHLGDNHLLGDYVVEGLLKNNLQLESLSLSSSSSKVELTARSLDYILDLGKNLKYVSINLPKTAFHKQTVKKFLRMGDGSLKLHVSAKGVHFKN